MGKRKVFSQTDLSIPEVEYRHDVTGNVPMLQKVIPTPSTVVEFGRSASNSRRFDFARWYGAGIDSITYACQRQIERFLAGQDNAVTVSTITGYCNAGLRYFFDYCLLRASALDRCLTLADVNRDLIDGYLSHLAERGVATTSQKISYSQTKPVLLALGQRGLIPLVISGDSATFPRNPFPSHNRKVKGETALTTREREIFSAALRQAVQPIWTDGVPVTGELLVFALLVVALHTGRNTTPLLEMSRDCLRPHPKNNTVFLVLWKRRGHNISKVPLCAGPETGHPLNSMPSVKKSVERLILRVMELTEPLRSDAPDDLKDRMWLYRSRMDAGQVTALTSSYLVNAIASLVVRHGLTDNNGKPLRINISRLRKTFANRIFELTGGDLATTAAALGNTLKVAEEHYLKPDSNARRNWQFMGEVLVQELLTSSIGQTYKVTPFGRCADPVHGKYAPKKEGATCMAFMNCLRCKHYAVTGEDLYKLFSFYFRVLAERPRMDKRRWAREYAHIPRLIEHYIVAEGLRRGAFKQATVQVCRERARVQPHPFWSLDLIDSLGVFT